MWLLDGGDIAFVGDLAFNGTHAYLADGHTDEWLEAIDRAEEALARSGHRTRLIVERAFRRNRLRRSAGAATFGVR
jgi:glyoxylase-like metal-dependent hydrolase (beta-lactamase superfamily II)